MLKRLVFLIIVVLFLTTRISFSQMFEPWQPIEEPSAGNFFGVGGRYMGMGGTGVAFCNDAQALVYNPAGLAKVKRIEFTLGMTHQRLKNQTGYLKPLNPDVHAPYILNLDRLQSNTRLGSAGLVIPIPTYRGSLVFGFGVNRVSSFDHTFKYIYSVSSTAEAKRKELISESGGIYVWSVGGAIDISPNVSLGLSLNFWDGKDNYTYLDTLAFFRADTLFERNKYIELSDDYSGFNVKFGMIAQMNKYLSFGMTVASPVWLTIDEEYNYSWDSTHTYDEYIYYDDYTEYPLYKISHPFSFTFGGAFSYKNLLLAGDINYTDWSQLEYREGFRSGVMNIDVKEYYRDVFKWHLGAEFLIPQISGKLRAGYYEYPLPFKSDHLKSDRRFLTLGLGFLIDKVMTLDISWNRGFYDFEYPEINAKEKYTTNKIFITTAYRL